MNGALVVLLICAADIPTNDCNEHTARVVVSTRIEQIICGVGTLAAPIRMNMGKDEVVRIKCRMR